MADILKQHAVAQFQKAISATYTSLKARVGHESGTEVDAQGPVGKQLGDSTVWCFIIFF